MLDKEDNSVQVETSSQTTDSAAGDGQEKGGSGRRPQRYKIYDRLADNVSVNTMNIIIAVVAALLIFFVIYGIATGNPPQ